MSDKFFFKGKKEKKPKHSSYGFNTKRVVKAGTEERPVAVTVTTQERADEIQALADSHNIIIDMTVDSTQVENITELDVLANKPVTTRFEKTPARNEPCSCGSGKKYKKCCG